MKYYADKKRLSHPFKVGDQVLVKLRPYRQVTARQFPISKLAQRFYGPFPIVKQIGEVAFELELPPGAQIHPVFHVSKLKPFHNQAETPTLEFPPAAFNNQPKLQPLAVLDWRTSAESDVVEALIQWKGLYPEDTTWENLETLQRDYPTLHLEDKVFVEGKGDVMAQEEITEDHKEAELSNPTARSKPKRQSIKPKYFDDYDCTVKGKMK